MNYYEIPFAVTTESSIHGIGILRNKIISMIEANAGRIVAHEYWGITDLAYKIKGQTKARFFILMIESAATLPDDIKKYFNLQENIIRYDIYRQKTLDLEPSERLKTLQKKPEYLATEEEKGYATLFTLHSASNEI